MQYFLLHAFFRFSITPQVYRIKRIVERITGGVADVINERKADSESVTGQGADRTDGSSSASRHRDGETAGQNDSLLANSERNNKGYGDGRSEGTVQGEIKFSERALGKGYKMKSVAPFYGEYNALHSYVRLQMDLFMDIVSYGLF